MVDVRSVQRVSAPEPVLPAHLATKNYVDQTIIANSEDAVRYGDVLSSLRRDRTLNQASLANGYQTFSSVIAPRPFTATKVRFYVAAAGTTGISPGVGMAVYDDGARAATAPVATATFTSAGIKELTLSSAVPVVAGHRYTVVFYIAANSYSPSPSLGCSAAYFADLSSPTAALTFNGYKTATGVPPSSITTGDGTWTAHPATVWWALL